MPRTLAVRPDIQASTAMLSVKPLLHLHCLLVVLIQADTRCAGIWASGQAEEMKQQG